MSLCVRQFFFCVRKNNAHIIVNLGHKSGRKGGEKGLMNVSAQCFVSARCPPPPRPTSTLFIRHLFTHQRHILQYSGLPQKYNKSRGVNGRESDVSRRRQFISLFHILWGFIAEFPFVGITYKDLLVAGN